MNRKRFVTLLSGSLFAFIAIVGCGQFTSEAPVTGSAEAIQLTVSAAASVQDALKEIQAVYQAEFPEVVLTYNFGSSGSLAQQITQGAPADVFLSASPQWMDDLESQGQLLEATRRQLLQNSMVLIAPANQAKISDFKTLETEQIGKIAIGEPESVPAGSYAKEVLTAMALFDALQPKLVYGKDVRQVLAYVETGNVDAGLVYATDAQLSDRVQVVATAPADSHSPIVYPVAVVNDSANPETAKAFVEFLASEEAQAIFQKYGFSQPQ